MACASLEAQNRYRVFYKGTMRATMHERKYAASITTNEIPHKNVYGLGPLEGMNGEVTVFNDTSYTSSISPSGEMSTVAMKSVGMPFFVYAAVKDWITVPIEEDIKDIRSLEALIEKLALSNGISITEAFPFVIKGKYTKGKFHVLRKSEKIQSQDAGYEKIDFDLANMTGDMVGFFSRSHQGVFIHHDQTTHIHVLEKDRRRGGHLDEVSIQKNDAVLMLPKI
jgi:acetolactate decarboxylase